VVAVGSKIQLVKVEINPVGEDSFRVGHAHRIKATQYAIKVDLSAVTGLIASMIGKQPQETDIWVLHDKAPAFSDRKAPSTTAAQSGGLNWFRLAGPQGEEQTGVEASQRGTPKAMNQSLRLETPGIRTEFGSVTHESLNAFDRNIAPTRGFYRA
jgi:hypothetical protein